MSHKERYRLADSTVVEPLINSWAVWGDLISPAPYSLHLLHYQGKILSSFLADPEVHARACRNPKLLGGRFVDIAPERAPEVARLLAETEREQGDNLELARAITAAFELVSSEGTGHSLEPLYAKLPEAVRGYAELLYDYYNHATVRLLEGLLYESPYYKERLQSLRLMLLQTDESRPFLLSTPRLPEADQVEWAVPFAAREIDELFRLDAEPKPLGEVRELLGLSAADEPRLRGLLTSEPLEPAQVLGWGWSAGALLRSCLRVGGIQGRECIDRSFPGRASGGRRAGTLQLLGSAGADRFRTGDARAPRSLRGGSAVAVAAPG